MQSNILQIYDHEKNKFIQTIKAFENVGDWRIRTRTLWFDTEMNDKLYAAIIVSNVGIDDWENTNAMYNKIEIYNVDIKDKKTKICEWSLVYEIQTELEDFYVFH